MKVTKDQREIENRIPEAGEIARAVQEIYERYPHLDFHYAVLNPETKGLMTGTSAHDCPEAQIFGYEMAKRVVMIAHPEGCRGCPGAGKYKLARGH